MLTNTVIFSSNGELTADDIKMNDGALKNKLVIRNLFTLAVTGKELSYLSGLLRFSEIEGHYGYTSVGIIEDSMSEVRECKPGDLVLIPGFLKKYIVLSLQEYRELKQILFLTLRKEADPVKMLFYPMMYLGSQLKELVGSGGTFRFQGCHIVGFFLLQLLKKMGKKIYINLGIGDLRSSILEKYGPDKISVMSPASPSQTAGTRIIFEASSRDTSAGLNVSELFQKQYMLEPWKNRCVEEQFLSGVCYQEMEYEMLVDYHVHAEALDFVNKYVRNGAVYKRILIYDW